METIEIIETQPDVETNQSKIILTDAIQVEPESEQTEENSDEIFLDVVYQEYIKDQFERLTKDLSEEYAKNFVIEWLEKENAFRKEEMLDVLDIVHDEFGNIFVKKQGTEPKTWFTAHFDTVQNRYHNHMNRDEIRYTTINDSLIACTKNEESILGADDRTGILLLLEYIHYSTNQAGCAFFSQEEVGCVGSSKSAAELRKSRENSSTHPMISAEYIISLDRKGTQDIITHQRGNRTASTYFCEIFSLNLLECSHGKINLIPTHGVYTDSASFSGIVKECTNISVGYTHQHTQYETQDLTYLTRLAEALPTLPILLMEQEWSRFHQQNS